MLSPKVQIVVSIITILLLWWFFFAPKPSPVVRYDPTNGYKPSVEAQEIDEINAYTELAPRRKLDREIEESRKKSREEYEKFLQEATP